MSTYLTAAHIYERYNISESTLARWVKDEDVAFPKPVIIKRRRLFPVDKVESWERSKAREAA